MKVLILGATGMLGHKLYQTLLSTAEVIGTIREDYSGLETYGLFAESRIVSKVDVLDDSCLEPVISGSNPDVLINCVGIVKQLEEAENRMLSIEVNSLLPHRLYKICRPKGIRLIHISTDCVFSGRKGDYREDELSDAEDIYGKTKYLGEVSGKGALTIRTSLIGRELYTSNGLVEWFLSNRGGMVNAFTNAIFSGFPTLHFARILSDVITTHQDLSGVYHVSAQPISKLKLLTIIRKKMRLDIEIKEHPAFYCDRSLDSTLFRTKTGFVPLPWELMIEEFAEDAIQYQQWRE